MLCVSPAHFAEHLTHLGREYWPMSLREMRKRVRRGRMPHKTAVITFDDGYADNFVYARSLLEAADVPATLFVTSGMLDQEKEFWWDELERIVLRPARIPRTLTLRVSGLEHRWSIEEEAGRRACHDSLHRLLMPLGITERQRVIDELAAWAGADAGCRADYRPLNRLELKHLANSGLVEIGAHSVTHPLLPTLTPDAQWNEIALSRKHLEDVGGGPVTSFAYPFGGATSETRRLVREAGFTVACSTVEGVVTRFSNPLWLPRVIVRDWDGDRFALELRRALAA